MSLDATKRSDLLLIPMHLVVVDHSKNGRFDTKSNIQSLASSIKQDGQLQAVVVKRVPKSDTYELIAGYRRFMAIQAINEELPQDQRLGIKATVASKNDTEIFLANITENHERKDLSPMDYAIQIRRLTEEYGWSQKQCADKYNRTAAWVSQHLSLTRLNYDIQQRVDRGLITFTDAVSMAANATSDEQREVSKAIEEAQAEVAKEAQVPETATDKQKKEAKATATKKVKEAAKKAVAKAVKKAYVVPPSKKETKQKEVEALGKRTPKDMYEFLEQHMDSNKFSKEVRLVANILLNGWDGKIREDADFSQMFASAIDRVSAGATTNA